MKSSSSSSSIDKFVEELPKANFMKVFEMYEWEGYWFVPPIIKAAVTFRKSFEARNDDVFLASSMKTGTTWLKALLFCIMQRQNHKTLDTDGDALTMKNPHLLVPTVEADALTQNAEAAVNVYDASSARLLHTHLPHVLLPDSVKNLGCKIIYVARNPKDTLISGWHFYRSILRRDEQEFSLQNYVDCFCSGLHMFGPYVEHVAEYWEESRKSPHKILFLKYEELKDDPKRQVIKIAQFLERPFGDEVEKEEVDEIVRRCSFERLKNLEVNKNNESIFLKVPNNSFFRKGEVGDFKNYLTPEMEMQIHQKISSKFEALGLYL